VANVTANIETLDLTLSKYAETAKKAGEATAVTGGTGGTTGTRKPLPLTIEEKKAAVDALAEVEKSVTEFGVAVQKTIAGTTKSAVDNAVAEYQALAVKIQEVRDTIAKKAKVPGVDQGDIQAQRAQLDQFAQQALAAQRATIIRLTQEEREAIRDSVTAAAAAATGSAAESARQAVEHQTAALYKQIEASHVLDESEKNRLRTEVALADELGRAKVAATAAAERVAGTVASIDASTARGALPAAGVLPALNAEALNAAQRMRELEAKGLTNSDAYREYQRQILTIEQRRKEILDAIATRLANQKQIAKDLAEQETQRIQAEAYAIQQAVDGALQLAAAFGLVGEETANVLRSVGQVAAGIGPLVDAVNRFKDGTGGIASLIGAALPVAGGIASLISATGIFSGPTPEQLQQEKTLRENTVALQHLTEKIGILGVDLTGTQASNAAASAEKLADLGFLGLDPKKVADFITGYKDLGKLTQEQQDELKKAGEAFGLTMDGTIDSYQKAVRAILAANGKLGEFGDDFQSFTNQAEAARKIFGKDNPAQRLTDLATAATKASPAIAKLFEGLDLTKSGDLETLRKRIQDFFSVMEAGGQTLSAEDLGALTGDQLVQFLEQAIDGIDALSPAAQSAADKLATARQNLGTEFEIFGDDAKAQLGKIAALYGAQGGAFAQLVAGLDPTSADSVQLLEERIKALFQQLQDRRRIPWTSPGSPSTSSSRRCSTSSAAPMRPPAASRMRRPGCRRPPTRSRRTSRCTARMRPAKPRSSRSCTPAWAASAVRSPGSTSPRRRAAAPRSPRCSSSTGRTRGMTTPSTRSSRSSARCAPCPPINPDPARSRRRRPPAPSASRSSRLIASSRSPSRSSCSGGRRRRTRPRSQHFCARRRMRRSKRRCSRMPSSPAAPAPSEWR
jgi:hypothetical protein